MRRAFKYRAYPTRQQGLALEAQVDEACRLYNAALDERRSAWRMNRISLNYYDQAKQLKAIRAAGDLGVANFSACQDILHRVERSFVAFFRRVEAGEKAGYPRFRSRLRYDSLTWPSWGDGCGLRASGRLYLQGVGDLKIKWHRPLPAAATIKAVTARRQAGHWYVCFSVDMLPPEPLPVSDLAVGVDVGLTTFAVISDGTEIANPRHFRAAERRLRLAQRKLARRSKRSRRRLKARQVVVRVHEHVANQRRDFHHKTARELMGNYGLIAGRRPQLQGTRRVDAGEVRARCGLESIHLDSVRQGRMGQSDSRQGESSRHNAGLLALRALCTEAAQGPLALVRGLRSEYEPGSERGGERPEPRTRSHCSKGSDGAFRR
jgi:putative transposase